MVVRCKCKVCDTYVNERFFFLNAKENKYN